MNEVGTGKTFTYLLSICLAVKRLEMDKAEGKVVVARPTLLVLPAGLLSQTFCEASKNFPGLKFWSFYSNAINISQDDPRREVTLTRGELDDKMGVWANETDVPDTATNVVISSYSTLGKRWVKSFDDVYDSSQYNGPWHLDRYILLKEGDPEVAGNDDDDDSDVDEALDEPDFELPDYEANKTR